MKTSQVLIALALLACIANATDVTSLFQSTSPRIGASDLSEICGSDSKKAALNRFLFKQADTNGDGYLSLSEFTVIYNRFTQVVGVKSASQSTITSRFNMADHKVKDNRLNFSEFIWLTGSDLSFANSNYSTMTGSTTTLTNLLNFLNGIFNNAVFQSLFKIFTATLDKTSVSFEKFKSIINWLPVACKVKINWTDCVLQGYYKNCDLNGNGVVTLEEISTMLPTLLNDLTAIIATAKK